MQSENTHKLGGDFHELTNLKIGEKYTLLTQGFFGAVASKITLIEVKIGPYAQYQESVQLIFKEKGKRSLSGKRFYGIESCVVWLGWIDVDTDPLSEPEDNGIMLVRRSKYASCDSRFLTDAVASVSQKPVFSHIHEFISK